jgi:hypothetical protein
LLYLELGLQVQESFVIRHECDKVTYQNGFRRTHSEIDGWQRYSSTTAQGSIWLARDTSGAWFLALNHSGVIADIGIEASDIGGPGLARFRFPLDEVLVLPERQYPIRARHIQYYEDWHFGPIDRARKGKVLPAIQGGGADGRQVPVGKLSELAASAGQADAEVFGEAAQVFQAIAKSAKRTRKVPARV